MVSFADLRDIDPYVFREGESAWLDMSNQLKEHGYEIRRVLDKLDGWAGSAAEGAKATFREHERRFLASADTLNESYQLFHQAGDRIGAAKAKIMDGAREVQSWNLSVADDGRIFDEHTDTRYGSEEDHIRDAIRKYEGVFREAMSEANQADAEIAAGLRRLTAEAVGLAPPAGDATTAAAAVAIPPRGTAPADVKKWWDSLSPMQQESLLFTRAAELGALDGVPALARDRANRFRLAEENAELLADQQRLLAKHRTHDEDLWLQQINDKLHGIEDIEKRLNTIDPSHREAFLLAIDGNGNGRAIIAAGNPDTAANVATYVPGTGADLAKVGADLERSDRMLAAAAEAGSPSTSVITWVGYDAPQNIVPEAGYESFADGAKKDLDRFQDGLRATHEGAPSHNTVLGHSYGSTVIGHAARDEGLNADELVFVGSPGVGVVNASQLNFPPDHVHASVAAHDMIHLANTGNPLFDPHGPDPTSGGFGAQVFTSDPGTPGFGGTYSGAAHSEYWEKNNDALKNMGRIIAGMPTY
ncbi:MAG: alpha/beta hydrolase [Labedaea sp.]